MGDPDGVFSSWLWPDPAQTAVANCGMNQQIEDDSMYVYVSVSLITLPFKQNPSKK